MERECSIWRQGFVAGNAGVAFRSGNGSSGGVKLNFSRVLILIFAKKRLQSPLLPYSRSTRLLLTSLGIPLFAQNFLLNF